MQDPKLLPAYAFKRGFRAGAEYAAWHENGWPLATERPDTTNPYTDGTDESDMSTPLDPRTEPSGVVITAPDLILGPPELWRTTSSHVVLTVFPWTDDDHGIVVAQLHELLDTLVQGIPGLSDPRTPQH